MPYPSRWQDVEGAPPPGTALCQAADIADGQAHVATFRDGSLLFEMFVLRPPATASVGADAGGLIAYVNDCPHARTPLDWQAGQFLTADKTRILCATHGAEFRFEDGLCVHGPCPGARLTRVPIAVRDGTVVIAGG